MIVADYSGHVDHQVKTTLPSGRSLIRWRKASPASLRNRLTIGTHRRFYLCHPPVGGSVPANPLVNRVTEVPTAGYSC